MTNVSKMQFVSKLELWGFGHFNTLESIPNDMIKLVKSFKIMLPKPTVCVRDVLPRIVMVFSFLPKKKGTLLKKNAILCLFLKNVSRSKRVVYFILNNLHLPMVEGIAFYALYKSRVLLIPCKADYVCLFIGLPDVI